MSSKKRVGELTDVGISEHKSLIQFILHPIHLTANDAEQRFAVNQNFDAILLHRFVKLPCFVHVLKVVCQARTASVFDPDSYEFRLWEGEEIAELGCSCGSKRYGCFSCA